MDDMCRRSNAHSHTLVLRDAPFAIAEAHFPSQLPALVGEPVAGLVAVADALTASRAGWHLIFYLTFHLIVSPVIDGAVRRHNFSHVRPPYFFLVFHFNVSPVLDVAVRRHHLGLARLARLHLIFHLLPMARLLTIGPFVSGRHK